MCHKRSNKKWHELGVLLRALFPFQQNRHLVSRPSACLLFSPLLPLPLHLRTKSHSVSQWLPLLPPSPPMPPGLLTPPPTLANPRRRKSCSTHSRPLLSTRQGKSSGCCSMTRCMTLLLSWTRCVVPSCSLGRDGYGDVAFLVQLQGIGRERVVEVV